MRGALLAWVVALLLPASAAAIPHATKPTRVGAGHGHDPGARRRRPPPIDAKALPAPPPRPALPGRMVSNGPRDVKRIALTFDACPSRVEHGGFRRDIVDFLRRENVPATLFVSSRWAIWRPEVVQELAQDPLFELQSHGAAHLDLSDFRRETMARELGEAQRVLHHLIGKTPVYFRPPQGAWNARLADEAGKLGLAILEYDVPSGDADPGFSTKRIVKQVLERAQSGSIVVFHLNGPAVHTLEALPAIVGTLRERGFELVTVEKLLEAPVAPPGIAGDPPPAPPYPADAPLAQDGPPAP